MSCYKPLKAFRTPTGVVFQELGRHDIVGDIALPCGRCIGCRARRASDWRLRVMHEAQLWPENCFVTLTYADENLPAEGSLRHRDFQLFLKRLRKHFKSKPIRFYMCGEYGPLNSRPHYHAVLFNVDFRNDRVPAGKSGAGAVFFDSALLSRLWGLGKVSVQDLTPETAGYVSGYIMKKALGETAKSAYSYVDHDGVVQELEPEYANMSLRPGIGAYWFERFGSDVYPRDYAVDSQGRKHQVPKYYDKLVKRSGDIRRDDVLFARELLARESASERSPERLEVREFVHKARLGKHRRDSV